ncbi:MAG: hypothetical protein ACJARR_000106 [Pseudophaeobacter arcticus]|jgi:hypothetical protein
MRKGFADGYIADVFRNTYGAQGGAKAINAITCGACCGLARVSEILCHVTCHIRVESMGRPKPPQRIFSL